MKEYQNRKEVPKEYCFNLNDFFENDEEWESTLLKLQEEVKELTYFQGKLSNGKELEKYLESYFKYASILMDLYAYAYLKHDVDLKEERYIKMLNKIETFDKHFDRLNAFFNPEIVSLSHHVYHNLFQENKNLSAYKRLLDDIYCQKEHTLEKEKEEIIQTLTETFNSYEKISSSLINQEHNYGKIKNQEGSIVEITANNIGFLKRNPSKKIRKKVNQQFGKILEQYQNTESALLHNYVKNSINLAKLKKYDSPWQRKLEEIHLSNEIFENLKNAAKKQKKVWQNYFLLMKQELNLKTLHNYDLLLEWNPNKLEYSIEDAQSLILEALKPLGKKYNEKLKKVFKEHYIDYCGYKGKVSGGYSYATFTQNSRIVLTFKGTYSDILTIAHESGHNVHHQFTNESNPIHYRHSSSFVAEVASLTNEFLVNYYIAKNGKTKTERLSGIEHTLKTFQNNFFGSIREGEIEQNFYDYVQNGNTITANYLNDLVQNSYTYYLNHVIKDDGYLKLNWITRSHYYMDFYLYSYAICAIIAAMLANKIIQQENGIIDLYLEFLKCGSDMYPEEIYQKLGIDLKKKGVFDEGISFFEQQLNLYQKIKKEGEING